MYHFTLRKFEPTNSRQIAELKLISDKRFSAAGLQDGKQWLSSVIAKKSIESGFFYRFEGMGISNVSLYLFEDARICPVRIWKRSELYGPNSAGSEWTADFNGLPPWSAIASIEPRWRQLPSVPEARAWVGRSSRDWQKRNCWVVNAPVS